MGKNQFYGHIVEKLALEMGSFGSTFRECAETWVSNTSSNGIDLLDFNVVHLAPFLEGRPIAWFFSVWLIVDEIAAETNYVDFHDLSFIVMRLFDPIREGVPIDPEDYEYIEIPDEVPDVFDHRVLSPPHMIQRVLDKEPSPEYEGQVFHPDLEQFMESAQLFLATEQPEQYSLFENTLYSWVRWSQDREDPYDPFDLFPEKMYEYALNNRYSSEDMTARFFVFLSFVRWHVKQNPEFDVLLKGMAKFDPSLLPEPRSAWNLHRIRNEAIYALRDDMESPRMIHLRWADLTEAQIRKIKRWYAIAYGSSTWVFPAIDGTSEITNRQMSYERMRDIRRRQRRATRQGRTLSPSP